MFDRRFSCFAHAAVLALSMPLAAFAQRPGAAVAEARARVDKLLVEYKTARDAMLRADSIAGSQARQARRVPLDSAAVGPFTVVYLPKDKARVLKLVRSVWSEQADRFAGMETRGARVVLLLQIGKSVPYFDYLVKLPRHHPVWIPVGRSRAHTRALVVGGMYDALAADLPDSVQNWVSTGDNYRPLSRGIDGATVYRELATAPTEVAIRCFRQDTSACQDALGLQSAKPNEAWYTFDQLQGYVRGLRGPSAYDYSRCIERGVVASCMAVLRPYGLPPAPITTDARASLVLYALEKGGRGSFVRMQTAPGDLRHALEAASGTNIDELTRDWRKALQQSRPIVYAGSGRMRVATLFWIVLLTVLAMRSTRERIV